MRHLRSPGLRRYLLGFMCLLGGAGLSGALGSMLPLALGSAAALMGTAALVREIWAAGQARRARKP